MNELDLLVEEVIALDLDFYIDYNEALYYKNRNDHDNYIYHKKNYEVSERKIKEIKNRIIKIDPQFDFEEYGLEDWE